jgi:hypothetical protein
MIEKTVKTIDGKLKIKIPSLLSEITLGQMMAMQDAPQLNDLSAISILSSIPIQDLQNVCDIRDFDVFGETVLSLSGQIKYLYYTDDIPQKATFYVDDKAVVVNVIRNLSVEPAGAFLAARDIIAEEINEHITLHGEENWKEHFNPSLKACCDVLAHYFYCKITGKKYNEYQVEEFYDTVKQLKITEALPIAKYFFLSYPNLSRPRTNFFRRLHPFWRKRPAFNRSKSSSM